MNFFVMSVLIFLEATSSYAGESLKCTLVNGDAEPGRPDTTEVSLPVGAPERVLELPAYVDSATTLVLQVKLRSFKFQPNLGGNYALDVTLVPVTDSHKHVAMNLQSKDGTFQGQVLYYDGVGPKIRFKEASFINIQCHLDPDHS